MENKNKEAWRAELERRGLENVKLKLLSAGGIGRGALIRGFENPPEIPRDLVEDWVSVEEKKAIRERYWTLDWAIVGGLTGISVSWSPFSNREMRTPVRRREAR